MSDPTISISIDFPQPVDVLFAYIAKHENQATIFGVKVERLRDGDSHPDGVGSTRRLRAPGLPPFEETITVFEPGRRIEYKMNPRGTPVADHLGVIAFRPAGAGTHMDYTIRIVPKIGLMGPFIRAMTKWQLKRGLEKLASSATLP